MSTRTSGAEDVVAPVLDLRLLLPALGAWAGTVWALVWPVGTRAVVASVLLLGAVAVIRVRHRLASAGLLALTLLATSACLGAAAAHDARSRAGGVEELAARRGTVEASGIVLTEPLARAQAGRDSATVTLRLRLTTVTARGEQRATSTPVLVRSDDPAWAAVHWHDRVSLRGRLAPARPGDPTVATLSPRGPPEVGPRGPLLTSTDHMRGRLREAVAALPPDARGLVPALVIGDTTQTPPDLTDDMLLTGMSHLSAVSGSNVVVILAAVLGLTRVTGCPRRARPWVAALGLAWFVMLARPEPSVIRAATMGAVGLLGMSTSRRGAGAPALSTAVVALLLLDPWLARSYGFALSTLATLGLLLFVRPWAAAINAHLPRGLHLVGPAVAIPVAAHLACAPVVVLLQGSVSTVSILANLVAAPFVAPVTIIGVSVALVALALPVVAGWLAWLAALPALAIARTARVAADVPGGSVDWPDGPVGALLLAAVTVLGLLAWPWLCARSRAAPATALALVVLLVASTMPTRVVTGPPRDWVMAACDVGQGDALVLRSGPGRAVLVDAGPEPGAVDRCLSRLGVDRLDAVVLTHFHADHVDGLEGALSGREVGEVVVTPVAEPEGEARRIRSLAARHRVPVVEVVAGDEISLGEVTGHVWWPARRVAEGSVPNNASVVLHVRVGGLDALLLGDVEREAARAMLLALRRDPVMSAEAESVDVLKAPHHGSSNLDDDFMDAVGAPVALVSVGKDNDYGHPAPAALAALARSGSAVWRTDKHGTVVVTERDGRPAVASLR